MVRYFSLRNLKLQGTVNISMEFQLLSFAYFALEQNLFSLKCFASFQLIKHSKIYEMLPSD